MRSGCRASGGTVRLRLGSRRGSLVNRLSCEGLIEDHRALSLGNRDRVNLDQVAGGHRRYPDHYVCWLVISEQRYLGLFDDRHVFVAFVIDDVDCDLADLLRPGTGSSKRTAEIAKRQARLSRKITMANELAV